MSKVDDSFGNRILDKLADEMLASGGVNVCLSFTESAVDVTKVHNILVEQFGLNAGHATDIVEMASKIGDEVPIKNYDSQDEAERNASQANDSCSKLPVYFSTEKAGFVM